MKLLLYREMIHYYINLRIFSLFPFLIKLDKHLQALLLLHSLSKDEDCKILFKYTEEWTTVEDESN